MNRLLELAALEILNKAIAEKRKAILVHDYRRLIAPNEAAKQRQQRIIDGLNAEINEIIKEQSKCISLKNN